MAKIDIINKLIDHFGYKSYLEIGVQYKTTFNKVLAEHRVGIDPDKSFNATFEMTSNEFFAQNKEKFDIIFVDGLHEADQVLRDIVNSLKILNKDGTIVVHDCNPTHKNMQKMPRMQSEWTGDVWRAWVTLRSFIKDLNMFVIDLDYGVGIVRAGKQEPIKLMDPKDLTYENLELNRKQWLNLVPAENWMEYL